MTNWNGQRWETDGAGQRWLTQICCVICNRHRPPAKSLGGLSEEEIDRYGAICVECDEERCKACTFLLPLERHGETYCDPCQAEVDEETEAHHAHTHSAYRMG